MKRLIIVGAGGHGTVVADIAEKTERYSQIAFLDDKKTGEHFGLPILGTTENMGQYIQDSEFFVAIGNSSIREKIMLALREQGAEFATLVHPKTTIGRGVEIGKGSVIMAGVVINPCVKIGDGVIINTCASVDHNCIIGDFCHISVGAHIAGTVWLQNHVWIGAGAILRNDIKICAECMIGAGAVAVKDIVRKGTYIGVPAREKK